LGLQAIALFHFLGVKMSQNPEEEIKRPLANLLPQILNYSGTSGLFTDLNTTLVLSCHFSKHALFIGAVDPSSSSSGY
jgi:hypothetical protein